MRREFDVDEHGDGKAQQRGIKQGNLSLDQPFFLHAMNAPPARRLRELYLFGDFRSRQIGVVLQQAQNLAINRAKWRLHNLFPIFVFLG